MKRFFFENRAVYEKRWNNIVEPDRPRMTIWRKHISCWIRKAANTHPVCVILIAFPLQQWLYERPSMLRYTYIACPVLSSPRSFAFYNCPLSFSSICSYVICRGPTLKLLVYFQFQTFACYRVGITESHHLLVELPENSSYGSKLFPGGQTRGHEVPQTMLIYTG